MKDNKKKALMYGAGSIGRGFLGQLFSMSGYTTCFVDVDESLVKNLNERKSYIITVAAESGYESQYIRNVMAVNGRNSFAVADEIASCDIMATAVGVNILPLIAKTIAAGIDLRSHTNAPLDIIVCENITDGGKHLRDMILPYVKNTKYLEDKIGFVSASVGRMVPVSMNADSSDIVVESYNELPIDADALKTDVTGIKNFVPVSPFAIEKYKKYFMHNMSHAIVAYLGFINKYIFLWEAMENESIREIARKALKESTAAIARHFNVDTKPLSEYADDLLKRYSNVYLNDTVKRVGRDPKRKLSPKDRLTGAVNFCLENGIDPEYIIYGIAAAFYFNEPDDVSSGEIIEFTNTHGISDSITEYTSIPADSQLHSRILQMYLDLKQQFSS